MSFKIRFTPESRDDLERLFAFIANQDPGAAERAVKVIDKAWELLATFPLSCRKATPLNPFLRELVIPFGRAGYVALFEIEDSQTITLLAVRHQREDDYY